MASAHASHLFAVILLLSLLQASAQGLGAEDIASLKKVQKGDKAERKKQVMSYYWFLGCGGNTGRQPEQVAQSIEMHMYRMEAHFNAGVLDTMSEVMDEALVVIRNKPPTDKECKTHGTGTFKGAPAAPAPTPAPAKQPSAPTPKPATTPATVAPKSAASNSSTAIPAAAPASGKKQALINAGKTMDEELALLKKIKAGDKDVRVQQAATAYFMVGCDAKRFKRSPEDIVADITTAEGGRWMKDYAAGGVDGVVRQLLEDAVAAVNENPPSDKECYEVLGVNGISPQGRRMLGFWQV